MINIKFDYTSAYWSKNDDMNRMFVTERLYYLKGSYYARGYLYLNEIYGALGIRWDPEDENICIKFNNADRFNVSLDQVEDNEFVISICY